MKFALAKDIPYRIKPTTTFSTQFSAIPLPKCRLNGKSDNTGCAFNVSSIRPRAKSRTNNLRAREQQSVPLFSLSLSLFRPTYVPPCLRQAAHFTLLHRSAVISFATTEKRRKREQRPRACARARTSVGLLALTLTFHL